MDTFFRIQGATRDPQDLRDPAACRDLDNLADYFRERTEYGDDYIDTLALIELTGDIADDDHDEDDGAVLTWPSQIAAVSPIPDYLRTVLRGEDD